MLLDYVKCSQNISYTALYNVCVLYIDMEKVCLFIVWNFKIDIYFFVSKKGGSFQFFPGSYFCAVMISTFCWYYYVICS